MLIKAMAVFCGSQKGSNPQFERQADELGVLMARHNIRLIYGGGNVGLMGVVADAVLQHGGEVVGVIPYILDKMERSHQGLTELLLVEDMHVRKKKMYELCDAAIILPGGYGTLDEFFEMITWNALAIHNKQLFILNTNGFYDHLLQHIHSMYTQGFLYESPKDRIAVVEDPKDLLKFLSPEQQPARDNSNILKG